MGIADKILKGIMRPAVKRAFDSMNKDGEMDKIVENIQNYRNERNELIYEGLNSDDAGMRMTGKKIYNESDTSNLRGFDKSRVPNFDAIPQSKEQAKDWLKESKEELDLELITQEEFDKIKEEIKPYILAKDS